MFVPLSSAQPAVRAVFSPERVDLDGRWTINQPDRGITCSAHVPGVVQADLLAAGKIPDPFYRDNETADLWIGEVRWTYSRTFTLPQNFVDHRQIWLRCLGLDTLADVRVNGVDIAHVDNMFRTWEFDVRPYVHAGSNIIEVTFDPVEPYLKAHEHQAEFPDKPTSGWGYIRKAPFQNGWDFAPKVITCGIWRDIGLVGWDEARITDVGVDQDHSKAGVVGLTVSVDADTSVPLREHVTVLFHGRPVSTGSARVDRGNRAVKLSIAHPELWWPAGMGAQNLYEVRVRLTDARGQTVDSASKTIGLRTITWLPKTNDHPLTLAVNGRPFYAKGSNWVPCDSVISRATSARERRLVDMAVDAHLNFMRLWGGGYYEDDAFFDECDRKGLMLWSEFKFADAAYPIFDPAWMANVRAEAADNIRRLRLHPSIAVWSGNNECIGFVADKTDADHMTHADYELLFHQTLPDILHEIAPGAVYTPGSPESGDDHDWSVWHGNSSFESYRDVHGFMSEFGFQAFPQPNTVDAFTLPSDRTGILTPIMHFHQRNWRDADQLMLTWMKRYYHQPKDFQSTLWLSQIQQADGILTGVEHWRRDWPNSTGSLVWQFDDCWPGASWSMVDYFGRPKALYYRLKHAYAPVALSGQADDQTHNVDLWVCNDLRSAQHGTIRWALIRTDGTVVDKGAGRVTIPAGESSTHALSLPCADRVQASGVGNMVLRADLTVPRQPTSSTLLTFTHPKYMSLADPRIHTSIARIAGSYRVTLTAVRPALRVWLDMGGVDAHYSDNFVDVCPGYPATIDVKPSHPMLTAQFRKALRVRSLYDTFPDGVGPESDAPPITKAAADGTIVATAENADIVGTSAFLETGSPGNIGNWSDVNDYLQWTVKSAKPGTYDVSVVVACPSGEQGSTFVVDVAGGSKVTGVVPSTADWWTYTTVDLGIVTIAQSGDLTITLKPTSKPSTHVMNLRTITFKPVQSKN